MNLDAYERLWSGAPAVLPLAHRARWKLSGPDAERYLNGQTTADISKLRNGEGAYAAICTAKGRMDGDLFIARHAGEFFLDAAPTLHESLGLRLEKYLIADDAALEDISAEWNLVHLFGSSTPPDKELTFAVPRIRYGLPGHDIWTKGSQLPSNVEEITADIADLIRLEHGLPVWDAELSPTVLPPEGGPHMLAAISYTKGCYVGQETIARLKSVGRVNRTLAFFHSQTAEFPAPASRIISNGNEVGTITSAAFSPRLKSGIALGYVSRALAEAGASFQAAGVDLTIAEPIGQSY